MFAKSISENAIHGSDSDENAKIECEFHFSLTKFLIKNNFFNNCFLNLSLINLISFSFP